LDHRAEHRVSTASPVTVRGTDSYGKPFAAAAGALDVSHSGARLCGLRVSLQLGARIEVESKGQKTPYLVEWIGADDTLQAGQIGAKSLHLDDHTQAAPAGTYQRDGLHSSNGNALKPGSERRRFPRKICRLDAQVTTEDESVRLAGRVTDISLDGCYVEMLTPLPSGTLIHISLTLEDGDICVTGIVRYSQNGLGMGVEFMAMSPEYFERLRTFAPTGSQIPARGFISAKVAAPSQPPALVPAAIATPEVASGGQVCHLPTTAEALEVIIRVLSRKGLLTREELSRELESLKTAKN